MTFLVPQRLDNMAAAALFDLHAPEAEQPHPAAFRRESIIANVMHRKNSAGADERNANIS